MTLTGVVKVYSSVRVSRIDVDISVYCGVQVHKVVHEVVYLLFCSQCGVSDHYWAYQVVCVCALLHSGSGVYDCHSYCVHEVG